MSNSHTPDFRPEEGEGEETWLLTYVDMVSLLLGLFVILFAFSSLDAKKFEDALKQIQASLGGPVTTTITITKVIVREVPQPRAASPSSTAVTPSPAVVARPVLLVSKDREDLEALQRALRHVIQDMGLKADVDLESDTRGVILTAKGGYYLALARRT